MRSCPRLDGHCQIHLGGASQLQHPFAGARPVVEMLMSPLSFFFNDLISHLTSASSLYLVHTLKSVIRVYPQQTHIHSLAERT
jgi:hypothetical protein